MENASGMFCMRVHSGNLARVNVSLALAFFVYSLADSEIRKTMEWSSCLREPCTGDPHLHGNDTQVAIGFLGAFRKEQGQTRL